MKNFVTFIIFSVLLIDAESKKPYDKREQVVWRLECEIGVVSDADCPTDGGWSPWSPWSTCSGACDDVGHYRRTRECINPPPSNEGLPCSGVDQETEPCFIKNCTVRDFRKIVKGDSSRAEALHQLETAPALLERCLVMTCPYEAIEAALAADNTWQINPESLWNSLLCVKYNLGCPVVGEWGGWGAWSACGARCGYGLRWRLRRCDSPPPSQAPLICSGTPLQADECQGDQCAINKRDFEGTWSDWGEWSECSEKCGPGVRRRKRNCSETYTLDQYQIFGKWGTHCRGQHDQLEVCESRECNLDGGWSGWGLWGSCSKTCGAGRRSRFRSCTRPLPAGNGTPCIGSRSEIGFCHISPCESFTHTVAVFKGESFLQYSFENKRSTLFHFYVRFLPLSPHGTLVRRGDSHDPLIRLSLQKWHICLDAGGTSRSCYIPRLCSQSVIEPAIWHTVLVTLTSEAATMRLDDSSVSIKSTFPCDPELPDDAMNINVGKRLHGEIQEIILNFIPLCMIIESKRSIKSDFCPTSGSNVAYEKGGSEEAFLTLDNLHYLRLPCFASDEEWAIELTLKSKRDSGTVLFFIDELSNCWLHLYLLNMRLKMKLACGDFRSESSSYKEYTPGQWFNIKLSKKAEANKIEALLNAGERLHVLFEHPTQKGQVQSDASNKTKSSQFKSEIAPLKLCLDEYFVCGVPLSVSKRVPEDFTAFSGIIASIYVNTVLIDLHGTSKERNRNDDVQVSSRTASISGSYHEIAWGKSNRLNLTCLYARTARSPSTAYWLNLDVTVSETMQENTVRSTDDGRILRLVANADNDLRGFYTCRAHNHKRTRNIITYGVIGRMQHQLTGLDLTTAIAVFTSLALVLGTLSWLFIEGIHDLRNGYGFYRDAHLTPEEEAEAVCKYIDQNKDLVGSDSAVKIAKARARQIGRQLASRASFAAQEPEGMMECENIQTTESESDNELDCLSVLPEVKSSNLQSLHDVFKCDQTYVSSPCHGSVFSPRIRPTSSSSYDSISPRTLCSKLFMTQRIITNYKGNFMRRKFTTRCNKTRSKLLTIKSSAFVNQSTAQKVLQKFRELKSDDPV